MKLLLLIFTVLMSAVQAEAQCLYRENELGEFKYVCDQPKIEPLPRWLEVYKNDDATSSIDTTSLSRVPIQSDEMYFSVWEKLIFSKSASVGKKQADTLLRQLVFNCNTYEFFVKQENWFYNGKSVYFETASNPQFMAAPPETTIREVIIAACSLRLG